MLVKLPKIKKKHCQGSKIHNVNKSFICKRKSLKLNISLIPLRICDKIRVFQLEGTSLCLVYLALYLSREIIEKKTTAVSHWAAPYGNVSTCVRSLTRDFTVHSKNYWIRQNV